MGVLCCHFRPKMFSPGDHVRYHSRTLGAHVLATVVGPSPNGTQFCHIRYIRPGGVTPVDHESAQVSRLEAVAVESPKSPESPDVTPMSPQPQTPAQPTQPTMAANVPRKRSLQSTLDAFLKPNPVVTDDGSDAIVQLTGSPTQPKRPRSPTVAEDAVFVSAVKGPAKRRSGPQLSLRECLRAGYTKNVSALTRPCLVWFAQFQRLQSPRRGLCCLVLRKALEGY